MGISETFRRVAIGAMEPRPRDPSDDFWFSPAPRGGATAAGATVTIRAARSLPVVRGCIDKICGSIAGMPFGVFERLSETERKRRDDHPIFAVFSDPNPEMTSYEFVAQIVSDLATHGNFYGEILEGQRGPVDTIWRLEPEYITIERLSNRAVVYRYREPGAPERLLSSSSVWHIRRPPLQDNLKGLSPIDEGREEIGTALALRDYAARFFGNDATPPWGLKWAGNFKDDESRVNFMDALKKWLGGRNQHTPGVFEYGMEPVKLGVNNDEAQFLDTRKEVDLALARIWAMQPHKVGILDKATFSNITQQSVEYVVDTLMPWIGMIEKSAAKDLIIAPRRFKFEFNVAGLLRGDIETRYKAYALGRQWGWLNVDTIHRWENMNPDNPKGHEYAEPPNVGSNSGDNRDGA